MKTRKNNILLSFAILFFLVLAQQLYVDANYHPQDDKNIEKIRGGIQR